MTQRTMRRMAKKPKKSRSEADETDPVPAIRMDPEYHAPIRRACRRFNKGVTRLVNDAVRDFLEEKGFWPPPDATPPPADTRPA